MFIVGPRQFFSPEIVPMTLGPKRAKLDKFPTVYRRHSKSGEYFSTGGSGGEVCGDKRVPRWPSIFRGRASGAAGNTGGGICIFRVTREF